VPSSASLAGSHLLTYNRIFQHPLTHNLEWREVRTLFERLGVVVEEPNGNLRVTRNGQTIVLHPERSKDVSTAEEVINLRHFLERSEVAESVPAAKEAHWLVVIDHQSAQLFRTEMQAALPLQILPHAKSEYFRHAHNSQDFSRGQDKPDPNSFFSPIAAALAPGGKILLFGSGTGSSSEMDQFAAWLKTHHPETSNRVIGSVIVDGKHLTEGELLAKAREFYANRSH